MKFTSEDSGDQPKLTIIYQTGGNGYIICEQEPLQSLAEHLKGAGISITEFGPINQESEALYRCNFVALQPDLRKAVEQWRHSTIGEAVSVDYDLSRISARQTGEGNADRS